MAKLFKVIGVPTLAKAVTKYKKEVGHKTERGLKLVGLYLQLQAQLLVPIDTGVLRNSAFTRSKGKGMETEVRVGFTAAYALWVHENMNASHPIGQAKYLEEPATTKRPEMRAIFKKEVSGGSHLTFGGSV